MHDRKAIYIRFHLGTSRARQRDVSLTVRPKPAGKHSAILPHDERVAVPENAGLSGSQVSGEMPEK
jgi:hypothetical protein